MSMSTKPGAKPVITDRLLAITDCKTGKFLNDIVEEYNAKFNTKYDRRTIGSRLAKLVKAGKLYRFKDEHEEPGNRYYKYFAKSPISEVKHET